MITEQPALEARINVSVATADRRSSERVPGPFDAWRIGMLETPVRIYDISLGGCFVHAMHEQDPGVVVMLKIHLPGEQWVEVKAEPCIAVPASASRSSSSTCRTRRVRVSSAR